jgi:hypothetical protein
MLAVLAATLVTWRVRKTPEQHVMELLADLVMKNPMRSNARTVGPGENAKGRTAEVIAAWVEL